MGAAYGSVVAALAFFGLPGVSAAAATGSIDCPVQALSAKERVRLGAMMIDGLNPERAQTAIAVPAKTCAATNGWTASQTEAAELWGVWDLMMVELEHRSGLAPTDLAAMHAYAEENPERLAGMERFSTAQVNALIAALRQRGAHLHDAGNDTEREIGFLMVTQELKKQEQAFARQ